VKFFRPREAGEGGPRGAWWRGWASTLRLRCKRDRPVRRPSHRANARSPLPAIAGRDRIGNDENGRLSRPSQLVVVFCLTFNCGVVVGTFHKMSAKYMPLYVAEFQFCYNNRFNPDIFGTAISGC
jgi:hypothetical protein